MVLRILNPVQNVGVMKERVSERDVVQRGCSQVSSDVVYCPVTWYGHGMDTRIAPSMQCGRAPALLACLAQGVAPHTTGANVASNYLCTMLPTCSTYMRDYHAVKQVHFFSL